MSEFEISDIENSIIVGDCLEILKQIPSESIDLVVTDPAYWTLNKWRGIGTTTRLGGHSNPEKRDKSKWFDCIQPTDLPDLIQEIERVLKPNTHAYIMSDFETMKAVYYCAVEEGVFPTIKVSGVEMDPCKPLILKEFSEDKDIIEKIAGMLSQFASDVLNDKEAFTDTTFYQNAEAFAEAFIDDLDIGKQYQLLVWDKLAMGMGYTYRAQHELILMLTKGPKRRKLNSNSISDVFSYKRVHHTQATVPTQKPLELFKTLVSQSSAEGEIVLDPFMGSGTTAIAAKHLGRRYIGIELSEENAAIAENNLNSLF